MSTIQVVNKRFPQKGHFIKEGSYNYFTTPDGLPVFAFRWQGMVFPGSKATFVFARDAVRIGRIPDDVAKSQARMARFSGTSNKMVGAGILVSLVAGAVGAATTRTSNIKGFGVFYKNKDGHLGAFFSVAAPEIVDEIFRSVPADRHDSDTPPPEQ